MKTLIEMQPSETMRGELAMESIERQVDEPTVEGVTRTIVCPFCGFLNLAHGGLLCCDDLRKALIAVLSGKRMMKIAQEAAEHGN